MTRRKWLRAVCIALIVLVAFSRLYLGVHYPSDVLFSLVVGIVLVLAAYPLFSNADEKPARVYWIVAVLVVLTLAFTLFVELHAFPADTDAENLASAVKNGWTLFGSSLGMLVSLYIERRYVNFDVKACWWAQIIKVVVGIALVLAIRAGLKPVLNAVFGARQFTNAIRYFCIVVFTACVWPLTFRKFAALGKKK